MTGITRKINRRGVVLIMVLLSLAVLSTLLTSIINESTGLLVAVKNQQKFQTAGIAAQSYLADARTKLMEHYSSFKQYFEATTAQPPPASNKVKQFVDALNAESAEKKPILVDETNAISNTWGEAIVLRWNPTLDASFKKANELFWMRYGRGMLYTRTIQDTIDKDQDGDTTEMIRTWMHSPMGLHACLMPIENKPRDDTYPSAASCGTTGRLTDLSLPTDLDKLLNPNYCECAMIFNIISPFDYPVFIEDQINFGPSGVTPWTVSEFTVHDGSVYVGAGAFDPQSGDPNNDGIPGIIKIENGAYNTGSRDDQACSNSADPAGDNTKNCLMHLEHPEHDGPDPVDDVNGIAHIPRLPFPLPCKYPPTSAGSLGTLDEDLNADGDFNDVGEKKECYKPFEDLMNCIDNVCATCPGGRFTDGGTDGKISCLWDDDGDGMIEYPGIMELPVGSNPPPEVFTDDTSVGNGWAYGAGSVISPNKDSDGNGSLDTYTDMGTAYPDAPTGPLFGACTPSPGTGSFLADALFCAVDLIGEPWASGTVNLGQSGTTYIINGHLELAGEGKKFVCLPLPPYDQSPERCTDGQSDDDPGNPDDPYSCVIACGSELGDCKYGVSTACTGAMCETCGISTLECCLCTGGCSGICPGSCIKAGSPNCCYVDMLIDGDENCNDWSLCTLLPVPSRIDSCSGEVECGTEVRGTVVVKGDAHFHNHFKMTESSNLYVIGNSSTPGNLIIEDLNLSGLDGTFTLLGLGQKLFKTLTQKKSVIYVRGDMFIKGTNVDGFNLGVLTGLAALDAAISALCGLVGLTCDISNPEPWTQIGERIGAGTVDGLVTAGEPNDPATILDDSIILVRGLKSNIRDTDANGILETEAAANHQQNFFSNQSWHYNWPETELANYVNQFDTTKSIGGLSAKHLHPGWDTNNNGKMDPGEQDDGDVCCHVPCASSGTSTVYANALWTGETQSILVEDLAPRKAHVHVHSFDKNLTNNECDEDEMCAGMHYTYAPKSCQAKIEDPSLPTPGGCSDDPRQTNYWGYAQPAFKGHADLEIWTPQNFIHVCNLTYINFVNMGTMYSAGSIASRESVMGLGNFVSKGPQFYMEHVIESNMTNTSWTCSDTNSVDYSMNVVAGGDLYVREAVGLEGLICSESLWCANVCSATCDFNSDLTVGPAGCFSFSDNWWESCCKDACCFLNVSSLFSEDYNNGVLYTNGKLVTGDKSGGIFGIFDANAYQVIGNVMVRHVVTANDASDFGWARLESPPCVEVNPGGYKDYTVRLIQLGFELSAMKATTNPWFNPDPRFGFLTNPY